MPEASSLSFNAPRWIPPSVTLTLMAVPSRWQVIVPGEPRSVYWHTANGVLEVEPGPQVPPDGWYLSRSWVGEHTDFAANTIGIPESICWVRVRVRYT